ncbi:hypothetical protein ON010_g3441 [Phytophthora cinnamomi]|nr:hypothetical protein ON010_g3441 [Phytophthora cinnamomi]
MFDGKVGLWLIVETVEAVRKIKNRPKGTEITTPIEMTNDIYERMLTHHVIPVIKRSWPVFYFYRAFLQVKMRWLLSKIMHRPTVRPTAQLCKQAAASGGDWKITFANRPPRSLDLGLFNSLQSLQYKKLIKGIVDLIKAVEDAYEEMNSATTNKCFLTLQSVMEASMLVGGGNSYKIPTFAKMR